MVEYEIFGGRLRQYGRREIILFVLGVVLVIVVIGLAAGLGHVSSQLSSRGQNNNKVIETPTPVPENQTTTAPGMKTPTPEIKTCFTPECLETAAYMLANMNSSVDPCEDFYQYACGNWPLLNPLPPNYNYYDVSSVMNERVKTELESILTKPLRDTQDESWEKKLKKLYKTCVENYARDQNGAGHLIRLVNETFGGWQLINSSFLDSFDIKQSVIKMFNKLNAQVFFHFYLSKIRELEPKIFLRPPVQGLSRTYLLESSNYGKKYTKAYRAYTWEVGQLLATDAGKDPSSDDVKDKIQEFSDDVVNFDKKIAEIVSKATFTDGKPVPIKTFQKPSAKIPISDILVDRYKDAGINEEALSYRSTNFTDGLEAAFNALGSNLARVINNYLVFYFAYNYAGYLSFPYVLAYDTYLQAIRRPVTRLSTTEACYHLVRLRMPDAFNAEYVFHHLKDTNKDQVGEIFQTLKSTLVNRMKTWDWMDKSTTDYGIAKLEAIAEEFGYPKYMANNEKMNLIYFNVFIKGIYGFFNNLMNTTKLEIRADVDRVKGNSDSSDWTFPPTYTSPYYQASKNALVVPAASIKLHYSWDKAPAAYKFGGLGSIMAQQLSRSVNHYGRRYLKNGIVSVGKDGLGWWSGETNKGYVKNRECITDYFDKKTAGPFIVNGKSSGKISVKGGAYASSAMYKITAVLGGYLAYKDWVKKHGDTNPVAILDITSDQAYFIAAVQSACVNYKDAYALKLAQTNTPINSVLYNGALSQIQEFNEAFKCSAKSRMNAQKKCNIF